MATTNSGPRSICSSDRAARAPVTLTAMGRLLLKPPKTPLPIPPLPLAPQQCAVRFCAMPQVKFRPALIER